MSEQTIRLGVKTVIGTGDPFDGIMLIPLISDWGVPRNCAVALRGEECDSTITRLLVLEEKVEGYAVLGMCEKHFREFHDSALALGGKTP